MRTAVIMMKTMRSGTAGAVTKTRGAVIIACLVVGGAPAGWLPALKDMYRMPQDVNELSIFGKGN